MIFKYVNVPEKNTLKTRVGLFQIYVTRYNDTQAAVSIFWDGSRQKVSRTIISGLITQTQIDELVLEILKEHI